MTDQGQPLSRRDRRAMEQQAAGQEAGTETGGIPTLGPDGQPLSRRDRRRLERSENPMEVWTAEEEQLATGQMPAMTPEVIAQQEALAREKARVAALEALAASAELRGVMPAEQAPQEPDASGIPEAFRHMFPPGSLQARAMNETAATGSAGDQGAQDASAASADPAEEIRRLTAAAMAGIGRERSNAEAVPSQEIPVQGVSSPYDLQLEPDQVVVDRYEGQFGGPYVDPQEQPQVPLYEQQPPASGDNRQAPGAFAGFGSGAAQADDPVAFPQFGQAPPDPQQSPPGGVPPLEPDTEDSTFEQLMGLSQPQPQPAPAQFNQPPAQFNQPPAPGGNPGFAGTPGAGVPGVFSPQSGQVPVTTGSIEIQRRAVPELDHAGGARDFRWAHLLVIGAIAFALGVVVWHLAGVAQ